MPSIRLKWSITRNDGMNVVFLSSSARNAEVWLQQSPQSGVRRLLRAGGYSTGGIGGDGFASASVAAIVRTRSARCR
jgi:hypothetical protein